MNEPFELGSFASKLIDFFENESGARYCLFDGESVLASPSAGCFHMG